MCIAFWMLDTHPVFWLILGLNRDEFHHRPTRPFHFWEEDDDVKTGEGRENILGGRDMRSGGTWMGLTKTGRLAFLTNVREKDWADRPERISRGHLPARFLSGDQTPRQYAELIALESHKYNGFNLIVADFSLREMVFVSNRHGDCATANNATIVRKLSPGLHSMSNGTLDSKWPKMERGKKLLADIIAIPDCVMPSELIVETVLRDCERADDVSLQVKETLCEEDFEVPLSSIFVETAIGEIAYGTRSMAVVEIGRDGQVTLFERYLEDGEWKDHSFAFQVEDRQPQAR